MITSGNFHLCDLHSVSNPHYCSEYASEIFQHLLKVEKTSSIDPNYMIHQVEINDKMRAILVDWLIEVHSKFKLQRETLYIAISIIDRYLASQLCSKSQL